MNAFVRKFSLVLFSAVVLFVGSVAAYVLLASNKRSAPVVSIPASQTEAPQLQAVTLLEGLERPWDIAFLPDKTVLFTERSGSISTLSDGVKVPIHTPDDVVAKGEGGMLGIAVDPDFSTNRYVYACFNSDIQKLDVRVVRWKVDESTKSFSQRSDIVTGIPANPSGRHSGCRIDFGPDGNLWIGTGDAAGDTNPQDIKSLAGKILRVDRDGKAVKGNLGGDADPRIFNYGHRNIQGLAFFDAVKDGSYGYSAEHGPDRDDEINLLKTGNFGWDPGRGYDESVPMTDSRKYPDAIASVWSSGDPTIAISDVALLKGPQWGNWEGRLVAAVLKDKQLRLWKFDKEKVVNEQSLFEDTYGRLRAAVLGPDGALYLTTDNGQNDRIIKVTSGL